MTDRLYYEHSYMREFDAHITGIAEREGKQILALDVSAFYPTSGGQPHDTGTINASHVMDVFTDEEGEVWHEAEGKFAIGDAVHCAIDWARRFDHMQQHAGEHMIAGAVYKLCAGTTIGLHLGAETSSIDVELPHGATRLSEDMLRAIEDDVNAHIQQDHAIRCWFPSREELSALPLRKQPTVREHVRIVSIGDFEMVACGGTHPSSTGQIGLVKIVGAAPARGKLRLSFVCGARAFADYRVNYDSAWKAANLLSTRPECLEMSVKTLLERLHAAQQALGKLRRERMMASVPQMLHEAERLPGDVRIVCKELDADSDSLKELASKLIEQEGIVVLLAARGVDRWNYIFARSKDVNIAMGALLAQAAKPLGGKGGGREDFAQGAGPLEAIYAARTWLLQARSER